MKRDKPKGASIATKKAKPSKKASAAEELRALKDTDDKIKAAVGLELQDHEKRIRALEAKNNLPVPEPKKAGWFWD